MCFLEILHKKKCARAVGPLERTPCSNSQHNDHQERQPTPAYPRNRNRILLRRLPVLVNSHQQNSSPSPSQTLHMLLLRNKILTCSLVTWAAPSLRTSSSNASGACRLRVATAACLATLAATASSNPPAALAARYRDGVSDKPTTAATGTSPVTPVRHARPGGLDCSF